MNTSLDAYFAHSGKRPLLTRKIIKNISGKNLPRELKKSVKVGE